MLAGELRRQIAGSFPTAIKVIEEEGASDLETELKTREPRSLAALTREQVNTGDRSHEIHVLLLV